MFNINKIVRETTDRFLGVAPNLATPEHMRPFLASLNVVTQSVRRTADSFESPPLAEGLLPAQFYADLEAWEERLKQYIAVTDAAPPGDRRAILWDVTAPLFLGYFGGRESTAAQRPPDLATPFMLGNQLQVATEFRDELETKFFEDLETSARAVAKEGRTYLQTGWPWVVGGITLVVVAGVVTYAYQAGKRSPLGMLREKKAA